MHIMYRAGLRHSLDVAASGIAILAGSAPLPGERPAVTDARMRGWATSSGELLRGTTGVGAPIRTGEGDAQAAISAVWLNQRDDVAAGHQVMAAAEAIAAAIG
jgi:DNA-binding IclR family transcriptional regulator